MASVRPGTLWKIPRRIALSVSFEKEISTPVGVIEVRRLCPPSREAFPRSANRPWLHL